MQVSVNSDGKHHKRAVNQKEIYILDNWGVGKSLRKISQRLENTGNLKQRACR